MNTLTDVKEPGSFEALTLDTEELWRSMIDAHKQTAEVVAHSRKQHELWAEAGYPKKNGPGKFEVPDGYFVLTWMQSREAEEWLANQLLKIEFVGNSYNKYIEVSCEEYKKLTKPRFKFIRR